MKKISHSRASLILLILITIWTTLILIAQAIPSLNSTIRFVENVKYEILGGYASDFFIQRNVTYAISYNIFYTLTLATISIFSVISIFKSKMVKLMGIAIIAQNTLLVALRMWDSFLIDTLNDTILINIKTYLVIIIIITVVFTIISFRQKIFHLLLIGMTLLQCFNTISFILEYIRSINNIYVIFECFCGILILILYWIILLSVNKSRNSTVSAST